MTRQIHDDEPDTSEPVVRALLAAQCPQWSAFPIEYLDTSGTDNAMWRVRLDDPPDVVVRLPRRPGAINNVEHEIVVLEMLQDSPVSSTVKTPVVRHVGAPHEVFRYPWTVLEWITGSDAWTARHNMTTDVLTSLAIDLGAIVQGLHSTSAMNLRPRRPGERGGPLDPLLDRLDRWLADPAWNAANLVDIPAVTRLMAEGREVAHEPIVSGFVHGDLIPGNLLMNQNRLEAILDWGGAGEGDISQDLAPAWSIFTAAERPIFRRLVEASDAAWIRGRTFELEHAVGGVLYYAPRKHPLGDVMARTLHRIITNT